jgi:hypothetical protein
MHQGLLARFDERFFAWRPYLNEELRQAASEAQESSLIEAGAIRATGFRWVGENPRR